MIYVILAEDIIDDSVRVVGYCLTKEEANEYLRTHPNVAETGGVYSIQYSCEQVEHL